MRPFCVICCLAAACELRVLTGGGAADRFGFSSGSDFGQALNQALAGGNLIVHDQRNGFLVFNPNGSTPGFGSAGVFAILPVVSALQTSDIALNA
jgi:hypothetical protein